MTKHNISWTLYIIGSLLVFGSWVHLVSPKLGWAGWLMAIAGWAIGNAGRQATQVMPRSKMDELYKLNILRKDGVVTEEEFEAEKEQILKQQ